MYLENGLLKPTVTDYGIYGFFGPYRFLSNFCAAPLLVDGIQYPSSEHAYMAQKTTDDALRRELAAIPTCREVKARGQQLVLRPGWLELRATVMLEVLRAKFRQTPILREKLLATNSLYLEETNNWGDTYWGVCGGKGLNMLGKTLMQVRNELHEQVGTPSSGQSDLFGHL